jgi:hypothetical protein
MSYSFMERGLFPFSRERLLLLGRVFVFWCDLSSGSVSVSCVVSYAHNHSACSLFTDTFSNFMFRYHRTAGLTFPSKSSIEKKLVGPR